VIGKYNTLEVCVKATDKAGQWIVTEGILYRGIQVHVGQLTDGASIPLFLRGLIPKGGPLFCPAVIHDTAYRNGLLTRKQCDGLFLRAMEDNHVNIVRRKIIYRAVRIFGSSAYNKEEDR